MQVCRFVRRGTCCPQLSILGTCADELAGRTKNTGGLDEPLIVGEAFKLDAGQFEMIQAVMRYQNNKEWE